jgi:hypothetical protein
MQHIVTTQQALFNAANSNFRIYYFLLRPSRLLDSIARNLKMEADILLGENTYIRSYPHITLMQFLMDERMEGKLLEITDEFLKGFNSRGMLSSEIRGSSVDQSIYIDIKNQECMLKQVEILIQKLYMNQLVKDKKQMYVSRRLHVTIAKKVPEIYYSVVRDEILKHRISTIDIQPSEFVILKNSMDSSQWTKVESFELAKTKSSVFQGS